MTGSLLLMAMLLLLLLLRGDGGGGGGACVDCKMRCRTMNAQQLKFRLGRKLSESDLLIQNEAS